MFAFICLKKNQFVLVLGYFFHDYFFHYHLLKKNNYCKARFIIHSIQLYLYFIKYDVLFK